MPDSNNNTLESDIASLSVCSKNIKFEELKTICIRHFPNYRTEGSHWIFKMPWAMDPRINIQKDGNMAKPYQVRQVLKALERLLDLTGGSRYVN